MIFNQYSTQILKIEEFNNNYFNIFKVLKQEEYENRHSLFLSWLLSPKASHNLKERFVEEFLKTCLKDKFDLDCNSIISVKTEVRTDGLKEREEGNNRRRIDILIIGDNFTCTIENKYGSFEHNNQCEIYENFINRKYAGYNNKFIFLDINKPKDFDTNKARYGSFIFISYFEIKEILKGILKDYKMPSSESLQISFIKQYVEVLEEKYQPLDPKLVEICSEIKDIEIREIIGIKEYEYSKLTESEKEFVNIIKKYYQTVKAAKDLYIYESLLKIVKNKNDIHDYGQGYAYAIKIPNKIFNDGVFIDTIDYTALDELKIAIYGGLSGKKSKYLIDYVNNNETIWDKLVDLKNNGWEVNISYRIGDSSNYLNKDIHLLDKIICDVEDKDLLISIINSKYAVYRIPKKDTLSDAKEKIKLVKECLSELEKCKIIDNKRKEQTYKKIDEKCKKGISAGWSIEIVKSLGITFINDNNKEEIKELYRKNSLEGMDAFGLKDKLKNTVLIDC